MGAAYSLVIVAYINFFRAGLGLDIEERLKIFGLRTQEEWQKWERLQEARDLERLAEAKTEWESELAKAQGISVKQLRRQQAEESLRTEVPDKPMMLQGR
jgi:hypothetical protein